MTKANSELNAQNEIYCTIHCNVWNFCVALSVYNRIESGTVFISSTTCWKSIKGNKQMVLLYNTRD